MRVLVAIGVAWACGGWLEGDGAYGDFAAVSVQCGDKESALVGQFGADTTVLFAEAEVIASEEEGFVGESDAIGIRMDAFVARVCSEFPFVRVTSVLGGGARGWKRHGSD